MLIAVLTSAIYYFGAYAVIELHFLYFGSIPTRYDVKWY